MIWGDEMAAYKGDQYEGNFEMGKMSGHGI